MSDIIKNTLFRFSFFQYVAFLLVILVFEIAITVVGFGLQNDAAREIRTPMVQSLQQYEARREVAVIWDDLQMGVS